MARNTALALLITNPTVALSGVLTVWMAKFASDKYSEKQARDEIRKFTDRFCKVTSNLNNRYLAANNAINRFYVDGDSQELFMAVADLLSAKGKEDEGTFDLVFNDEAEDLSKLKQVEMPD